jgi:filamentous hemagglutinin
MAGMTIDEDRVRHIFRDAEGHFVEDTSENRKALISTASRPENFLGTDRFGNEWWAERRDDGAQVREGRIMNGGINTTPRNFDLPVIARSLL